MRAQRTVLACAVKILTPVVHSFIVTARHSLARADSAGALAAIRPSERTIS